MQVFGLIPALCRLPGMSFVIAHQWLCGSALRKLPQRDCPGFSPGSLLLL